MRSQLVDAMRKRMPLTAWAAYLLFGGSVLFSIGITLYAMATKEDRTGPDPYAEEDLAVLRPDPLMNVQSEGFSRTSQSEVVSNYICAICDFFPTGLKQSFELRQEPSAALATVERAARQSGWTVVERKCTTEPALATLIAEKNFEEFHTSALFEVNVGGQGASMRSRASITHDRKWIRTKKLGRLDCLDEKWREVPPVHLDPTSVTPVPQNSVGEGV